MDPLSPGDPREIGAYRIQGLLGSGGMGRVFFGRSPGGRPVAVKVVRPELAADASFRRRFVREVEAARRVGGFHTVPVVDADPEADPPWVVTAFVPGPSLAEKVGEHGPLPPGLVRELGAGLAEGLAAIHSCGLVHRDLKPENVLMGPDGPRIIDFGIARALDVATISVSGALLGTPAFMAPGQAKGHAPLQADDIFSLGGVLCFAATGRPPFGGGALEGILYRVIHENPDITGLSEPMRSVVVACLSKEPQNRPDATTLVRMLGLAGAAGTAYSAPSRGTAGYEWGIHPRELAAQCHDAGDLAGAEQAIRHWISLEPANPEPLVRLCEVYQATAHWEAMLAAIRQWQRLDPDDWRPVAWTGLALSELERWEAAVGCYRQWALHTPDNPQPWRSMWIAAANAGDQVAALGATEGWVKAAADDAEAWLCYAQMLLEFDRFDQAADAAERSLNLNPDEINALWVHASALAGLERWRDAMDAYRRCAEREPHDANAWTKAWITSVQCDDRQAGRETLADWTAAMPDHAFAWRAYTRELVLAGSYEQAIEAAERAMALTPSEEERASFDESTLLHDYGVSLSVTGRWDRLAGFIDSWPDSEDLTLLTIKAKSLCELGRHSEAAATAARVTAGDGSAASAWETLARSLHELGEHEQEVDAAERWFALAPDNIKARQVYALALHEAQLGDRLLPVLDGWPGGAQDPQVVSLKAQALHWLGRHDEAVPVAARVIEMVELAKVSGHANPDVGSALGAFKIEAYSLYELGQFDGAAAAARQLLKHDANNSLYWFLFTRALIGAKQYEEALAAADRWIEVDPSGNAWSRKVQALMGLNRWEEARRGSELLLSLRPDDPNALSLMTTACAACNDERAIHYAERWVAVAPDSPDAQDTLERLRADPREEI
ncbi:hypothetical protein DPM19_29890 [Actinomadura craniellae]|uniref:Protein kinase domain-containing protein n=1 Tax=Actinomadura craniellae TaxID=2231787 RepID=A0A365GXH4_9ACTN|nr:serine/threonine-protein kinase [Actinomadura craniellae]RAY11516.1 hypothetical protein DPM19_29890 [Actinomadura craniellae]